MWLWWVRMPSKNLTDVTLVSEDTDNPMIFRELWYFGVSKVPGGRNFAFQSYSNIEHPNTSPDTPKGCLRMYDSSCWRWLTLADFCWCLWVTDSVLCCLEKCGGCLKGSWVLFMDMFKVWVLWGCIWVFCKISNWLEFGISNRATSGRVKWKWPTEGRSSVISHQSSVNSHQSTVISHQSIRRQHS